MRRDLSCNAYGATLAEHPQKKRRLGFNDRGWFWKCLRCGAKWPATDLPDEDEVKVIAVDPLVASLYGEPAV